MRGLGKRFGTHPFPDSSLTTLIIDPSTVAEEYQFGPSVPQLRFRDLLN